MNVLFVTNQPRKHPVFSGMIHFALPLLGAILKESGHLVDYVLSDRQQIDNIYAKNNYAIVCFSVLTGDKDEYLRISRYIKAKYQSFIIWGGYYITSNPEVIQNPGIDATILGEGELSLREFVNYFSQHGKPLLSCNNLYIKNNNQIIRNECKYSSLKDLNILPLPDYQGYLNAFPVAKKAFIFGFMTSRGCPYSCSYCHNSWQKKQNPLFKQIRYFSPERIIAEIKNVREYTKLKYVRFIDDIFGIDKNWRKKFLSLYREQINLPFICCQHPELISEDLAKDLKSSGVHRVFVGLECSNENTRTIILNRKYSNELIKKACQIFGKYKIAFNLLVIFGLPDTQIEIDFETVEFAKSLKCSQIRANILYPYKNTDIYDYCQNNHLLPPDFNHENNSVRNISCIIPHQKAKIIQNLMYLTPLIVMLQLPLCIYKPLCYLPLNLFYLITYKLTYAIQTILSYPNFTINNFADAAYEAFLKKDN